MLRFYFANYPGGKICDYQICRPNCMILLKTNGINGMLDDETENYLYQDIINIEIDYHERH